jgi:CRP-like cAMP-binding protein
MIKKIELFSKLSQRDIEKILKLSVLRKFKKGDVIFNQKEIGRNLFIVKSGTAEIIIGNKTQKPKILSLIEENEFFGELALLGAKYRTASAI